MSIKHFTIKEQNRIMILSLIQTYYEYEQSGGSLHVLLDDGNTDDNCVHFCMQEAKKNNDLIGETIAKMMLEFTETERDSVLEDI